MKHALAKFVRRGLDDEQYFFVRGWEDKYEFATDSVFHVMEPDINQELYSVPQYVEFAAIGSVE